METKVDDKLEVRDVPNISRKSAIATAVVAAVFCGIVLLFVVANYVQGVLVDTRLEAQLEDLRVRLRVEPDNEQLIADIRQLDLQFRRNRIRRLDLSRKGGFLLLGGVVILLIGVKWAAVTEHRRVVPGPGDQDSGQARRATLARVAVAGGLAVSGLLALVVAAGPSVDFGVSDEAAVPYPSAEEIGRNWHRFRGPGGSGISAFTNIADKWNGKTGDGILWKTEIPLPGRNSPIIWGDRVFLSGGDLNQQQVYCLDAVSGKLLWRGDVKMTRPAEGEEFEVMEDTGLAAPTMTTDGRRVYAIFAAGDVACFDFRGNEVWRRSLGIPDNVYGYACSLEMYRNVLLIQYDQAAAEDEKSALIALNGFTGQPVWRTKRPVPNSWASPILVRTGQSEQVITCGDPWVIGYNPTDGAELWRVECLSGDVAPSPIYAGGLVFVLESYSRSIAIRPDGQGDVTKTHIAWVNEEGAPDICSPVSNGELLFMLTTDGLLTCQNVVDGKLLWEQDLRESFSASPSLVGERLYLLSEKGVMFIVQVGAEYKELSRCELGEKCHASPAFVDGRIYLRGERNLYCIGQLPAEEP